MNYLDDAKQVIADGGGQDLQSQIFQFEEIGDELAGIVLAVDDFEGSEFDTVCKRYTIDTGENRVSCILGAAADRRLDLDNLKGKLIYIKFLGQKEARKGKHFNDYEIKEIASGSKKKG